MYRAGIDVDWVDLHSTNIYARGETVVEVERVQESVGFGLA